MKNDPNQFRQSPQTPRPDASDEPWFVTPKIFLCQITGNDGSGNHTWKERTDVGGTIIDFTDGRTCTATTDPSAAITVDGSNFPNETNGVLLEYDDDDDFRYIFIPASAAGLFPVIVKWSAGADGSPPSTEATWTYDLYAEADTGYVTKLNVSGALNPINSRARILNASTIKAPDGSVAMAFIDSVTGEIALWDLHEKLTQNSCDDESSDTSDFGF